jgi:plasmid stabilization system protein ParE
MYYDQISRSQAAADRIGRIADDYARANARRARRRARRQLLPAAELAARARRRFARPELQA